MFLPTYPAVMGEERESGWTGNSGIGLVGITRSYGARTTTLSVYFVVHLSS